MVTGSSSVRASPSLLSLSRLRLPRCSLIKVNKPTSWVRRFPGNCGGPSTPSPRRFMPLFYSPITTDRPSSPCCTASSYPALPFVATYRESSFPALLV